MAEKTWSKRREGERWGGWRWHSVYEGWVVFRWRMNSKNGKWREAWLHTDFNIHLKMLLLDVYMYGYWPYYEQEFEGPVTSLRWIIDGPCMCGNLSTQYVSRLSNLIWWGNCWTRYTQNRVDKSIMRRNMTGPLRYRSRYGHTMV